MKKLLLTLLLLKLICSVSYSQESNAKLLQKLVEKDIITQEEANELKNEESVVPEPQKENVLDKSVGKVRDIFGNIPYIKMGGYGLLMYQYKQYDKKSHHDMRVRAVFISIGGKITDNLSYFVLGELSDPMLYEYYADWTPTKEIGIRGGQFKVPFSFENPISLTNLETVFNTRSVSALVGMGDDVQRLNNRVNKTGRDLGIQLSGSLIDMDSHDLLQYAAGVFQGEGMNVSDKNNTKDFSGILTLQPIKGLRFAGSVYAGQAVYLKPGGFATKSHVRNRWAMSGEYKSDDVILRSEWIRGNDGGTQKEGLYGMGLWYFLPQKMNVVAKVDYLNQDKEANSEVMDYTLGLNYYFYKQCRLQLNYTFSDYSKKWGGSHRTENAVVAQMQIQF